MASIWVFHVGFNPYWNETFEFEVKNPEMALVRFAVYDQDVGKDDFIAQFSLPFTSIKQGMQLVINLHHYQKSDKEFYICYC